MTDAAPPHPPALSGRRLQLAQVALMLGNFMVGISVTGPTAMLGELSLGLDVSIQAAGMLITYGAVVLAFGSPLMAWLTGGMESRTLLIGSLLALTLGHAASAFAPNYETLVAVRIVMLVAAAIYTPQAASAAAMLVPVKDRSTAIAFVFLGWPLALSVGLPLMTFFAAQLGWRPTFAIVAGVGAVCSLLLALGVPGGLRGQPVSMRTWGLLARNRMVLLLLLITCLQVAAQFLVFTFLGPLLQRAGATPNVVGLCFALFGIMGFVGSVTATRMVRPVGALRTSALFLSSMLLGALVWSFGAGAIVLMAIGLSLWGLGMAATNSMQQARLVAAAPNAAGASVALNTSAIYVAQAVGSGLGGFLFVRGGADVIGFVSVAFLAAALVVLAMTRGGGLK